MSYPKIVVSYSDAYVFVEPHRKELNKNRLTICCHGDIGYVRINSIPMDALQLATRIKIWSNIHRLRTVRLPACYSADKDPNIFGKLARHSSLGARLSALLPNVFIKTYVGIVSTNLPENGIYELYTRGDINDIEQVGLPAYRIFKKDPNRHYHCITYLNGIAVKEKQNILFPR